MEVTEAKRNLNKQLIKAIKEVLPPNKSLPNLLMEMLYVSKDVVYRRIRGDVSFTLEELSVLSEKLNLSLDNVLGLANKDNAVFDLKTLRLPTCLEDYLRMLQEYNSILEKLIESSFSKVKIAYDTIPQILYLNYPHLTKFRLYRWCFQSSTDNKVIPFSTIQLNKDFENVRNSYIQNTYKVNSIELILGQNAFLSFVNEISYFRKIELINDEDMGYIKKDLEDLLIFIESIAATGKHPVSKKDIVIYLSNINIRSSYYYFECKNFESSNFMVYSGNIIRTQNDKVCKVQKDWIENMKRFSTLITNSGEIYRRNFFNSQRKLIEEILK
ncbi:MAG: hypothetical protein LUG18_12560 [Candidatus Azobacteroides sp.]|nr:hypothetical protein [Candidatus Azobacteroides sp.]